MRGMWLANRKGEKVMYYVLYKDDFGEKRLAKFGNYADAYEFYNRPSNVIFPLHILTEQEVWDYCTSERHV